MIKDMLKFRPLDFFGLIVLIWLLVTIVLNFFLPHSLFFKYIELEAESPVCRNEAQKVTGTRWALMTTPSEGVDQIYPIGVNEAADRFPWDGGVYKMGISTSTWFPKINVDAGEYEWKATTLRLNILWIFPLYLTETERPTSNVFTVLEC